MLGNPLQKKLIVIILLLCVTSVFSRVGKGDANKRKGGEPLRQTFNTITGYAVSGQLQMEQNLYDFLRLDDYAYMAYEKDGITLYLYIGYYYTEDKITAAHSPLVCFPAQGWVLDKAASHTITAKDHTVRFAEMEAVLGKRKQLILYWFQTYKTTTPHSHMLKLHALYNRMVHNEEQNAFVRIAIPMDDIERSESFRAGTDFIEAFYPRFLDYIEGEG